VSIDNFVQLGAGSSTAADRKFCDRMLPRVSRTFALSISMLPDSLRDAVGTAYLLCRVVDSIEDDRALSRAERTALFDAFDDVIGDDGAPASKLEEKCVQFDVGESADERELCTRPGAVVRSFRRLSTSQRSAIRPHVLTMSRGMREYCARAARDGALRMTDVEDLERYCYFVAGTVGELLTALFEAEVPDLDVLRREELHRTAVSFGQGLQLVNIVKDIAEDLERGVCFLPRDVAKREKIALEQVLEPSHRAAAMRLLEAVCTRADEHLQDAWRYTLSWPETSGADVRLFCAVPLGLAFATLREVRAGGDTLVSGRTPKVSREEVATIIADAKRSAASDAALSDVFSNHGGGPRPPTRHGESMEPTVLGQFPARNRTSELARAHGAGEARTRVSTSKSERASAETAKNRATQWLLQTQDAVGFWKGELQTNVTMDAEDLLLRQFLGIGTAEQTRKSAVWIRSQQRADGTWANAYNGPADHSTTVESYVALRLAGDPIDAPHMLRAASQIVRGGGLPATRVFTRIWLALFGLWKWESLPVLPPEMMLLSPRIPLNIYDFACWARQTIAALTVVMTYKPVRPIGFALDELAVPASDPAKPANWRGSAFEQIDRVLKAYQRRPLRGLRERALVAAEQWIVKRQEADGSWGGIQPPWVYSLMALHLRGYALTHPVMRAGLEGLERFTIHEGDERRLEACQSPVWDTAYVVLALSDAGVAGDHPAMIRAADWLMENEIRVKGDWAVRRPKLPAGGWAFEFANVNYPDIDDTAEVVLALRRVLHPDPARVETVITRGVRWTLGMQSRGGGWGAFDADNTQALCRDIPFCDFGEVIDEPSADVTAHVVELLAREGLDAHPATRAGIDWLLAHQEADGSWFGRWGVNYVYGTGATLMAFGEAKLASGSESVRRAVAWLESHQNADGGWGEDVRSYDDRSWAGRGDSTASQTAWALLGLMAVGEHSESVDRGIAYLSRTQREDGTWDEPQFTGTGFPGDFYINYHLYRQVFPTMALGRYLSRNATTAHDTSRRANGTEARGASPRVRVLAPLAIEAWAMRDAPTLDVVRTGMGPTKAKRAVARLASDSADHVVVVGFCGALGLDLQPGDVIVADEVRDPHGRSTACVHESLVAALRASGLNVGVGPIASTDHIVGASERRTLLEAGAKAVDMESAWLAPVAAGKKFSVVRVVVDAPGRELFHPLHTLSGGVRGWRSLKAVGRVLGQWVRDGAQ